MFPQYVTDALTKHAGLWPHVLATLGLYSLAILDRFDGLVGKRKVWLDDEAEPGVLEKAENPLPFQERGVP